MARKPADPRLGGTTVNEILQDLAIRHGVSVERLKSSEVKRLLDILAEADAEALAKLEARLSRLGPVELQRFGFGLVKTERLIKVREAIDEIADRSFEIIHGELASTMLEIGKAEVAFQAGAIAATVRVKADWITPSNTLLKTLVRARPFAGEPGSSKLLSEYAKAWSTGKRDAVTGVLRNAIILGQPIPEARKRVQETLRDSRIGAERIARTGIAHIVNAARQASYEENSDVIKGLKWVVALDSRLCKECASYGSPTAKVFPVSSGPRPPLHYSCRCVVVPVTKASIGAPVGSRASSKGEVPADIDVADFFANKLNKGERQKILGVTGEALFTKGKLPLDGFVDKSGRRFTLDELRARNAEAFERAGI